MFSVLLRIASGMMLYCAMLVAFVSNASKWWIVALFAGLGAVFLLGGLSLKRFQAWKRDAGIVLLSASGMTAAVALCAVSMLLDDEMMKTMGTRLDSLRMFSDYMGGGSLIGCAASLGWLLLRSPESHAVAAESLTSGSTRPS